MYCGDTSIHSPLGTVLFRSRKMLALEPRIGTALLTAMNETCVQQRQEAAVASEAFLTRLDMNLFEFTQRNATTKMSNVIPGKASTAEHNNTASLMRLVSVVMQDVQQKNLNAKHAAAATPRADAARRPPCDLKSPTPAAAAAAAAAAPYSPGYSPTVENSASALNHGEMPHNLYIGLNRSCSQRKVLEVCCVVNRMRRNGEFMNDIRILSGAASVFRVLYENDNYAMVCMVLSRSDLAPTLFRLDELPRLVFVSCKNQIYTATTTATALQRKLAYTANFVLYHAFHESGQSFDERRYGARFRHMRVVLFLAAVINAELLRLSNTRAATTRNNNLSLNIQSLGKAYDDVGLHIFAENSIQQVKKAVTSHSNDDSADRGEHQRVFHTDGLLVNRYLGRVSRVGVNAVTLTIPLRWQS